MIWWLYMRLFSIDRHHWHPHVFQQTLRDLAKLFILATGEWACCPLPGPGSLFWVDVWYVGLSEEGQHSDRRDSEATSASGGTCSAVGSQAQLNRRFFSPQHFAVKLRSFVRKRSLQEWVWNIGRSCFFQKNTVFKGFQSCSGPVRFSYAREVTLPEAECPGGVVVVASKMCLAVSCCVL